MESEYTPQTLFLRPGLPDYNLLCWITRWAAGCPCFSHVPTLFPLCVGLVWLRLSPRRHKRPIEATGPQQTALRGFMQMPDNKPTIMHLWQLKMVAYHICRKAIVGLCLCAKDLPKNSQGPVVEAFCEQQTSLRTGLQQRTGPRA